MIDQYLQGGRYRWRTELRKILPLPLARLIPKGGKDCGSHEWYNQDDSVDRCYHCSVGLRPHEQLGDGGSSR